MSSSSRGAISVTQLTVDYTVGSGLLRALNEVSLQVPAGHRMAIVGESGSGKSTLGLALMGLLPPNGSFASRGLTIDNSSFDLTSSKQLRSIRGGTIAMVFQDAKASLDPVRTVGSQIAEVLRVHRIVPRKDVGAEVQRLLVSVEIRSPEQVARQYPHELSGGMRQRAMIAAALAGRPSVLIADEPTSALDVTTQATVIDLLRRLGDTGEMSTILITHDLALVAGFADSVSVLYAGEVVEVGPVDRMYASPDHPYTRALLESIPSVATRRASVLGSIPGSLPDLSQPVVGCVFEPRCPVGSGRDVCRTQRPLLADNEGGGKIACHFSGELPPPAVADDGLAIAPVSTESAPAAIVEMKSIVKTFGRRGLIGSRESKIVAVGGVDLRIEAGESVGIVGESGSGKTTLARVLIGLEQFDSGNIAIAAPDGTLRTVEQLSNGFAQFIFQDPGDSLNPLMSVEQIVSEPLVLRDGGRHSRYSERVAQLLEDVGLGSSMASRRPLELSGGQRQRVAIARALSTRPKLIIADEAVASLDMSARGQILNLLAALQREHGFAYLHISHDLSMVRHICDRVVVMYDGRVVETAAADALFSAPQHPYTQALISAVPIPDPSVEKRRKRILLRTESGDVGTSAASGCAFRLRCQFARERCEHEQPVLDSTSEHAVACHFSEESSKQFRSAQPAIDRQL